LGVIEKRRTRKEAAWLASESSGVRAREEKEEERRGGGEGPHSGEPILKRKKRICEKKRTKFKGDGSGGSRKGEESGDS